MVQEALINVVKHAGMDAQAEVALLWLAEELVVEVNNTGGCGPSNSGLGGRGLGLRGITERIEALDRELVSGPVAPSGFQVRAIIPRRTDEEAG